MSLEELQEMTERLTEKLKSIPAYKSRINSLVPEGKVWCLYFNRTLAGRCNFNCKGYQNKFLEKVE